MINYICGKGFLILEPSPQTRGLVGSTTRRERGEGGGGIQEGPYQTFHDRFGPCAQLAKSYLFSLVSARELQRGHDGFKVFHGGHNSLLFRIWTGYWETCFFFIASHKPFGWDKHLSCPLLHIISSIFPYLCVPEWPIRGGFGNIHVQLGRGWHSPCGRLHASLICHIGNLHFKFVMMQLNTGLGAWGGGGAKMDSSLVWGCFFHMGNPD